MGVFRLTTQLIVYEKVKTRLNETFFVTGLNIFSCTPSKSLKKSKSIFPETSWLKVHLERVKPFISTHGGYWVSVGAIYLQLSANVWHKHIMPSTGL